MNIATPFLRPLAAISVLLFLNLARTSECAATETTGGSEYTKQLARTQRALVAAGDPDSLAAAATVGWTPKEGSAQRLKWMARAADLAPDRYDLVWLHLQLCKRYKSCDAKPIVAKLRALDASNAASWMDPLEQQTQTRDDAEADALVKAMAESVRFDIHWNSIVLHLTNALRRARTMNTVTALVGAIGSASAIATPDYWRVSNACKGEALKRSDRLLNCRRLAAVMRDGDAYATEMTGIAIEERVWPAGSAEIQDAIRARRVARHQMAMAVEAASTTEWNEQFAEKYLQWVSTEKTEQAVSLAEIANAGLNASPPQDASESRTGRP